MSKKIVSAILATVLILIAGGLWGIRAVRGNQVDEFYSRAQQTMGKPESEVATLMKSSPTELDYQTLLDWKARGEIDPSPPARKADKILVFYNDPSVVFIFIKNNKVEFVHNAKS